MRKSIPIAYCKTCGKVMPSKEWPGGRRIFCSPECRRKNADNKGINCKVCGKFIPRGRPPLKTCSYECRTKLGYHKVVSIAKLKICKRCGKEYEGKYASKYCSNECKRPHFNVIGLNAKIGYCKRCGKVIRAGKTFCSYECSLQESLDIKKLFRCETCGRFIWRSKSKFRKLAFCDRYCVNIYFTDYSLNKAKRRRRDRGKYDSFLKNRIQAFARDKYRCQYCGVGINGKTSDGDDVRLEADHIVPIAKGGTHSLDNLVTACQECNAGKNKLSIYPSSYKGKTKEKDEVQTSLLH